MDEARPGPGSDPDPLRRALADLSLALRAEIERHASGHLGADVDGSLRLDLTVDLSEAPSESSLERARSGVREAVEALIHHRSILRPGRVWCLRCASIECEHGRLDDPRLVFRGWSPTGIPLFEDFAQLLLERRPDRVDAVFRDPPELVTEVLSGRELAAALLPAYRDADRVRIHGQVVAGWYRVPAPEGAGLRSLATTLQIVSTPGPRGRRKMAVHVVGAGLGETELEHLVHRLGRLPWSDSARWAQSILADVERSQRRPGIRAELLSHRIEGILASVARRLEQGARSRSRRTEHAEERHRQGDRPTRTALADLRRSGPDAVLWDSLRSTWIVLGERARAHVFSPAGKLVTSMTSTPEATRRKKEAGRWQAADPDRVDLLRQTVLGPARGASGSDGSDAGTRVPD